MIRIGRTVPGRGPAVGEGSSPRASRRPVGVSVVVLATGVVLAAVGAWRWQIYADGALVHPGRFGALIQGSVLGAAVLLIAVLVAMILHGRVVRERRTAHAVEEQTRFLKHQAMHDVLTGLPNRHQIRHHAHELLIRSRSEKRPMIACLIDLDNFKEVNDTFGHLVGDQLLNAVARRLSAKLGGSGTIGRLGGDEFIVLAEGAAIFNGPNGFAQRILTALEEPFLLSTNGGIRLTVTASVGVAAGPRNDVDDLFRDADIALYRAKETGRGRYVVFEPHMFFAVVEHQALMRDLRAALGRGEFSLEYQPILDLKTGSIAGAEALLRWNHDERGTVGPLDFVPALEESGLIIEVGRFVLREATRQAALWHSQGHALQLAVNVSARQLSHDAFVDDVRAALRLSGLPPEMLALEITESALVADNDLPALRLAELKKLGVSLAVDDFGTGYASISYLRRFPFDILKIDQSYMQSIGSPENSTLLDAMLDLGHAVGMTIIAEGIVELDQLRHLADQGCSFGQGYGIATPTTAVGFESFLINGWRPALLGDPDADIISISAAQRLA